MPYKKEQNVIIIGAGLVGSLLAIFMAKKGHIVSVYEKRPDMRKKGFVGGRSINLALSDRGWRALDEVGVSTFVKDMSLPMKGRMLHDEKGALGFQPYGDGNQAIYSVSRAGLNETLVNAAENAGVEFFFEHSCKDINFAKCSVNLVTPDGEVTAKGDVIFGTDGANSSVRTAMQSFLPQFDFNETQLAHGYKELSIPMNRFGDFALDHDALHIWPRGQFMLIALPNLDKSFTCTLFFPLKGNISFESLNTSEKVHGFFKEVFPDALAHMPELTKEFFENPTSNLSTIRCNPWVVKNVMILGDAAHAIVPFYGQGMNAGFEDCFLLNQWVENDTSNWELVLNRFAHSRKKDADAISDLALYNFIEMRDLVADPAFLLRKKIEAHIHKLYPTDWLPQYSMVTFTHMPYSEAQRKGAHQKSLMDEVMKIPGIEKNWKEFNFKVLIDDLKPGL